MRTRGEVGGASNRAEAEAEPEKRVGGYSRSTVKAKPAIVLDLSLIWKSFLVVFDGASTES